MYVYNFNFKKKLYFKSQIYVHVLTYYSNKIEIDITYKYIGAVMVLRVLLLDLQLHIQSAPITTNVVSSNYAHGEVYSI